MSWHDTTITEAGIRLLMGALSGQTLTIVEAVGGVGVADTAVLPGQTDVLNRMQTLKLRGMKDYETHKKIYIQIGNDELAAGYTLNQIGVFAKLDNGEPEMLFIMQDSRGVYIPAASENEDFLFEMQASIAVSNDVDIQITVSSGVVVSVDFMLESIANAIAEHDESNDAHGNIVEAATNAQSMADWAYEVAADAMQAARDASSAADAAVAEAMAAIAEHSADPFAHSDIRNDLAAVDGRLELMELKYNTEVSGNEFTVNFDSVGELIFTGVWNENLSRVEF